MIFLFLVFTFFTREIQYDALLINNTHHPVTLRIEGFNNHPSYNVETITNGKPIPSIITLQRKETYPIQISIQPRFINFGVGGTNFIALASTRDHFEYLLSVSEQDNHTLHAFRGTQGQIGAYHLTSASNLNNVSLSIQQITYTRSNQEPDSLRSKGGQVTLKEATISQSSLLILSRKFNSPTAEMIFEETIQ